MGNLKSILIVDDEPAIRGVLCESLADMGYRTHAAESGEAALALFGREPWDMVITDVRMPGISGLDLLRRIRCQGATTPVIIITGDGTASTAAEAIRGGAAGFLAKPFSFALLGSTVEKVFSAREDAEGTEETTAARIREACNQVYACP